MTSPEALHSSENPDWATPLWIIDAVREALGGEIDLDPASSTAANIGVQARRIIEPPADGLVEAWRAERLFVNPPGGKLEAQLGAAGLLADICKTRSNQVAWWRKSLVETLTRGHARRLIFLAFSIELLQSGQSGGWSGPLDSRFSLCVPRKRIAFDLVAPDGSRQAGKSPSHANLIVGVGCDVARFVTAMTRVGEVRKAGN